MEFDPVDVNFLINREQVRRDSEAVKRDITGVDQTAEKSAKHVSETVKRVYDQNVKEVQEYTTAVNASTAATVRQGKALASTRPQWNGLNNSINQLSREMPAFAVSAQVGILALSNNIPILADEIRNLKVQNAALAAQGQATVPIWKRITQALFSWQTGLSLGVTLLTIYGREVGQFVSRLFEGKGALDKVKASQEALNNSLNSSEYQKGLQNVLELRNNFDLVREGSADADVVLKQYNETIGKVVGKAEDLNEAEDLFVKNSDKYVQALLYRQAAEITSRETAEKVVEYRVKEIELMEALQKEEASAQALYQRLSTGAGSPNSDNLLAASRLRVSNARAAINTLKKEQEEFVRQRNSIYQDFKRKEFGFGFLFDNPEDATTDKSLLTRRQALLDQIVALDKEYARKNLDSDEAELQALRDKFAKIRTLVERFNKDSKNKAAVIDLGELNSVEARSEDELLARQEKAKRDKEEKAFADQLKQLMSYNQERLALIKAYEETKQQLIEGGYTEELATLDAKHQQELAALDDAQVKKLESYQALNLGIERLTDEGARSVIASAKSMLEDLSNSGRISEELMEEILLKIIALEEDLTERRLKQMDRTQDEIRKTAMLMGDLGEALAKLGTSLDSPGLKGGGEVLTGLADGLARMNSLYQTGGSTAGVVLAAVGGVIDTIAQLIQSAKTRKTAEEEYYRTMINLQDEYNRRLNDQLRLQSDLDSNVFTTDYQGRFQAGAEALKAAISSYQAELANLGNVQVVGGQETGIDWDAVKKGFRSIGSTGAIWGLLFGRETTDVYTSILSQYPDIIQQTEDGVTRLNRELAETLLANGQISDETRNILENLLAWEDQIKAAEEQLNQVIEDLVGTIGNDLKDSLVEAFEAGQDGAQAVADTLESALENVVSNTIFSSLFGELFDNLQESLRADDSLDWADELAAFMQAMSERLPEFNNALQAAKDEAERLGLSIFDGADSASGLKGAIQRELTEATASELTGLYRATFDIQKRQLSLQEDWYDREMEANQAIQSIMLSNAMIERNTYNTVEQLKLAVTELVTINKNTKVKGTGYDRGF